MTNNSNQCSTFWDLLARNVDATPHRVFLRDRGKDVTFLEVAVLAERLAVWLAERGVQRGDRVAIHLPKSTSEVAAMFAAARVGAVFVNINAGLSPHQVAHVASDCGLTAFISDEPRLKRLQNAAVTVNFPPNILQADARPAVGSATSLLSLEASVYPGACPAFADDLAALIYTSGSTGRPKGVMLTHENIRQGAQSVVSYLKNTNEDRVLSVLPFSFDYGLNQLTTMLLAGGTLILQPVPMATEIIRAIRSERVTGLGLVPTLWVDFIDALMAEPVPFPGLRYITNSGGRIPAETLNNMARLLTDVEIVLMYGLTECFRSTWLPPDLFRQKLGAIGIPIPGAEIFVVDSVSGLCGPNEVGELLHHGPLVSQGYWQQPELTTEKIHANRHLSHLIGEEPVVHSGDLVRRDEEGILWYVGRNDCLIKTSGYRVSPDEVEEALLASGLLAEAIVFGVPDDRLGQSIVAIIRPMVDKEGNRDELLYWCQRNMPGYQIPQTITILYKPFPRNPHGKIDRKLMQESFAPTTTEIL
jgi:acyl-CoA ligase (AMP-forming) (exosortase A-associated)